MGSSVLPPPLVSTRTRFAFLVPMIPTDRPHAWFREVRCLMVWRWEMSERVQRIGR